MEKMITVWICADKTEQMYVFIEKPDRTHITEYSGINHRLWAVGREAKYNVWFRLSEKTRREYNIPQMTWLNEPLKMQLPLSLFPQKNFSQERTDILASLDKEEQAEFKYETKSQGTAIQNFINKWGHLNGKKFKTFTEGGKVIAQRIN